MRHRGLTRIDLLVVLTLIPLLLVAGCPSLGRSKETANRVKCASNLRQIGQALVLYAQGHGGQLPRTRAGSGADVTPDWGTGAPSNDPFSESGPALSDVSAAMYLLLRAGYLDASAFTCASTDAVRWDNGGGAKKPGGWSNWPRKYLFDHLSYSFMNVYPDDAAAASGYTLNLKWIRPELAVAADLNPGAIKNVSDALSVTTTSSARQMKLANSPNHDRDGQSVLYGDGHVEFQINPFVGVNRDHIYTRQGEVGPTSSAPLPLARSPKDKDDSVLLPHAE